MDIKYDDQTGVENPVLGQKVDSDTELKKWLVDYVGQEHGPEDDSVTVSMIVETVAKEFPEFVLVLAEENFIRGYEQALTDVETGRQYYESEIKPDLEDEEGS